MPGLVTGSVSAWVMFNFRSNVSFQTGTESP